MINLKGIVNPSSIALIGASEQKKGKEITANVSITQHLLRGPFADKTFLINPRQQTIYGKEVYASLADVSQHIETVVIVVPPHSVADALREAHACGTKNAIIITDLAKSGHEDECKQLIKGLSPEMTITGPNSLGIFSYKHKFVAGFFREYEMLSAGNVSVVAQSGGVGIEVLEKCQGNLSHVITIGNAEGISVEETLESLINDSGTKAVGIYLESYRDASKFLSVLRMLADRKPVVILHPSKSKIAQKAVSSHTGALAGNYAVFEAMSRIAGVLVVESLRDFTLMIRFLDSSLARRVWKDHPKSTNLTIVENAGGQGAAFTNTFDDLGVSAPEMPEEWLERLQAVVPHNGSCKNPIDIIGTADAERYVDVLKVALQKEGICLISITPTQILDPVETSHQIAECCKPFVKNGKMIFVVWSGQSSYVSEGIEILRKAGICAHTEGDDIIRMISFYVRHFRVYARLHATVTEPSHAQHGQEIPFGAKRILDHAKTTILNEGDAKRFAHEYGLPVVLAHNVMSVDEAVQLADHIGYPVVVKLVSDTTTHKSEYGVHLNLRSADAVRAACEEVRANTPVEDFGGFSVQKMIHSAEAEMCIGATCDAVVGPVIIAGTGGKYMEALGDVGVSISAPYMTHVLADGVWRRTNLWKVLHSKRFDLPQSTFDEIRRVIEVTNVIVRQHPEIKAIEFNPVLIDSGGRVYAVDARIILHDANSHIPAPVLRGIPWQFSEKCVMNDGSTPFEISPILPIHYEPLKAMQSNLSEETVRSRYRFTPSFEKRIEELEKRVNFDYNQRFALVAMQDNRALAAVRVEKLSNGSAEISFLVADDMQGRGIGTKLFEKAIAFAREEQDISFLVASTETTNTKMMKLFQKFHFAVTSREGVDIEYELDCSDAKLEKVG